MNRYYLSEPGAGHAFTVYGHGARDALNRYRLQWYPTRQRLPRGIAIWPA